MSKAIDYEAPPVVEVVAGITFPPIPHFHVPHFGLFWKSLPAEFVDTLPAVPTILDSGFTLSDMPIRCWFLTRGKRRLIQLQKNAFHFNWRRMDEDLPQDYPEFDTIYPQFRTHLDALRTFVVANELGEVGLTECELTYVNLVTLEDIAAVLSNPSDFLVDHRRCGGERFLPHPSDFQWNARYPLSGKMGILSIEASTARRKTGSQEPLFRLQLSAKGKPKSDAQSSIDEWFRIAHNDIVNGFRDIVDERIQREVWRRK